MDWLRSGEGTAPYIGASNVTALYSKPTATPKFEIISHTYILKGTTMSFSEKTIRTLEFDKICAMLEEHAETEGAKVMARNLRPSDDT